MPMDALTLAAVADELQEKAVGGRIQGVFLPAPLSVGLEIYAHQQVHYLFSSAHPQHARVHLSESKLSRGSEDVTPLLLLLRKYVRDGRLAAVRQPSLERTLSLIITKAGVFDKGQPSSPEVERGAGGQGPTATTVTLIIEIMGRYSNIILVDESGIVLEAVKHVPAEINRYRVTLPRHPYVLPPPQNKADPRGVSSHALAQLLSGQGEQPASQVLVRAYTGLSPLLAREVVFRASGATATAASAVAPDMLASSLAALLSAQYVHQWSPTLACSNDTILEFAPYALTQFGAQTCPAASMSTAIHDFYAQETVASDYAGLKQEAKKQLDAQRRRVMRRKESLMRQQDVGAQAKSLRANGEMLLACSAQIAPGQNEAVIEMAPGEPVMRIALDPRLSAIENAQQYFRRYTQARDAARSIPPLLDQVNLDVAYLDQLQLDLDMAKTPAEVREAQRLLAESTGKTTDSAAKKDRRTTPANRLPPLSYTSGDGMEILVGRNARQNEHVTFEVASAMDVWLHARGVAGSHVIIRSGGRPVSPQTLAYAASLAAAHSAARHSSAVAVDYAQRRTVRRARGGGPGLVTYSNEKTLRVSPAPSE